MAVKVLIPTPLRTLTEGKDLVEVEGESVNGLIESLETSYPGFKERICDDEGKIRQFVNIYVNDEDIRFLDNNATALSAGDEVAIVPAIAGGR